MIQRLSMSILFLVAQLAYCGILMAAPQVHFDVSRTVACQVIPEETQKLEQPGELLVQARVSVSLLVYRGEAEDIDECLYQFGSATSSIQIVDYRPRTTMDSSVTGNIRVQQSEDRSSQLNLNVTGGFELVQAGGGGSQSKAARSAVEYELLPPREMVAAAGTTGRGRGVYFKLRRTDRVSLEGSRDFLIKMRVPIEWRGGSFRAYCQAVQRTQRGTEIIGTGSYVIPLYLAGDSEAKRRAEILSHSEQRLYAIASKNQREVQRRSRPTIAHELAFVEPRIPAKWLQQVLEQPLPTGRRLGFESRLPSELQASIDEYRTARRSLTQLRSDGESRPRDIVADSRWAVPTTESSDARSLVQADGWRSRPE